jgi:hypothetical protein
LIFIGLNFIFTDLRVGNSPNSNTLLFKSGKLQVNDPSSEYNVIFSNATTDFTQLGVGEIGRAHV